MSKRRSDGSGWVFLLVVIVLAYMFGFCGCAGIPPRAPGSNNCGMILKGSAKGPETASTLTGDELADRLDAALYVAEFTTDPRLMDRIANCQALVGYRVQTMPTRSWPDPWGRTWDNGMTQNVGGLTDCVNKLITIGTPGDGNWKSSGLVHEIFHAMQNCEPMPPKAEADDDDQHAGWTRFGIYTAIEESYAYPKTE